MALLKSEKPSNLLTVISLLGSFGLAPFIVSVACMVRESWSGGGFQSASIFGLYAPYVFLSYSAIILSFLAGTLWGQWETFPLNRRSTAVVLIFTNLTSLLAWVSLTVIHISQFLSTLAVALLSAGYLGILGGRKDVQIIKSRILEFANQPDHRRSCVALDYSFFNDR